MKISRKRNTLPLLLIATALAFIGLSIQREFTSAGSGPLPERSGYVNDFAGVVDESTNSGQADSGESPAAEWDRFGVATINDRHS